MENRDNNPIGFLDLVWRFKFSLALYIFCISFATFAFLYYTGGVPQELRVLDATLPTSTVSRIEAVELPKPPAHTASTRSVGELPTRVIVDKIGIDVAVHNSESTDSKTLNDLLLRGSVRYPGSGTLGHGNMFIFGHSTSIKIVNNQAFKAFNHLKDLNIGDKIRIQSGAAEYTYKVTAVLLVDSDKVLVDFTDKRNMVTLSTCNVFGEKQERFVVEAVFDSKTSMR